MSKFPASMEALTIEMQQQRILKLEAQYKSAAVELAHLKSEIAKEREYRVEVMTRLRRAHSQIENLADRVAGIENSQTTGPISRADS